ncbi:MAG: BamA/TamA family outer membrane protein, partial [Bacteroidales bacterium]|nr:BamA/TamA family outer membrane protein [Bacteroidales bacterium]
IQRVLYEALGGGNTVRGMIRNRVLSNGFAFANLEFRFKICQFKIKKENFYIGLNPFLDAGMILQPYDINEYTLRQNIAENDPSFDLTTLDQYFNFDKKMIYRPHFSAGIGLKVAMNDNFVLSVDWAAPFNRQDAPGFANFYVKIGYMF